MKKKILIMLVLSVALTGCANATNKEVVKDIESVVEQELVEEIEVIEEVEELVGEVEEVEIVEIVEEVVKEIVTLDNFLGEFIEKGTGDEYIEEGTGVYVRIEEELFVVGYYESEGILVENPTYEVVDGGIEYYLNIEGLALDGFDFSEYQITYSVAWVDSDTIILSGEGFSYTLTRM